jgi:hypothetical protein
MYLRHTRLTKAGKTHTYWRLVPSVRRGRRVVEETVACLGELDEHGRAQARRLALEITGECEQYALFETTAPAGEPVAVPQSRSAWNGHGASAMSGSAGGCGAPGA